jgi:hypothetical protein
MNEAIYIRTSTGEQTPELQLKSIYSIMPDQYIASLITPYMDKIAIILDSKKWNINNGWFQQYTKSEGHEWHTHAKTNFTNVYFVELPSTSLGTEILNYQKLDLKEGDLLTLPGHVYHRSPKNFTNERKTIISFNSDFFDYKGI